MTRDQKNTTMVLCLKDTLYIIRTKAIFIRVYDKNSPRGPSYPQLYYC